MLAIIEPLQAMQSDYVFEGQKRHKPLSNMAMLMLLRRMQVEDVTVHGFRSTFRDWASEIANAPREVAEMSLAHKVGSDVERAYARSDLLEKRRGFRLCVLGASPLSVHLSGYLAVRGEKPRQEFAWDILSEAGVIRIVIDFIPALRPRRPREGGRLG
jgi:hypothetical protein